MIDHVLLDVIASFRKALEGALLEQQVVEERFQVDVFLGDVSFETSYSLPGEQNPPRVRADLSLDWPTWSQSSYRSWSIGEPMSERPEVIIEIALRLQRLAVVPDPQTVLGALGSTVPEIAGDAFERTGPAIEQLFDIDEGTSTSSIELAYQGAYRLEEAVLENPERIDDQIAPLARWIASGLVRLADLDLPFLPAEEPRSSE